MQTTARCAPALWLLASLICCSCSTFDKDWDAAAGLKAENPTDITGRWQGNWQSDASNHSGDLRCLVTRQGKSSYHARYAATYWNALHFEYEMNLTAERRGDWMHFEGQADLGPMAGGIYHYEGNANDSSYFATYKSLVDHGKFTMKRPR